MIKLFRRIRQKWIYEGKLKNYLLYSLGEIILVVIGILIALQINNWNTNKQETKELHNYLKNIQQNLRADSTSLEEIKLYRDSSIAYSKKYLGLIRKEFVTFADLELVLNSDYNVFFDTYFKSKKSGFEALKYSGYLGKLQNTGIDVRLNEYYYLIDKVEEQEASLNNTIENMEINGFNSNVQQQLYDIMNNGRTESYFSKNQHNLKNLLNHPNLTAANIRNSLVSQLPRYYRQLIKLGSELDNEIDKLIKKK